MPQGAASAGQYDSAKISRDSKKSKYNGLDADLAGTQLKMVKGTGLVPASCKSMFKDSRYVL